MDKDIIKNKNIISIIAIIILLLAIPSGLWPYGYYIFLRWAIAGIALFVLWVAYELKEKTWIGLMIIIVILFNPVIPVYLDKETLVIIDFIAALLFLMSIFKIKNENKK